MPAERILVLYAHPAPHRSRVQRRLAEAARALEGLTFHDLYEAYPDFDVDVPREQSLLVEHDLYVLQHPFYWYSTPPLVKQWLDLVLAHGWAYGREGVALRGRRLLSVLSTGGQAASYGPDGVNRFTVPELLAPLAQTARLCGVDYLPPFVVYGTHALGADQIAHAARTYADLLAALRDGRLDAAALHAHRELGPHVPAIRAA